MRLYRLRVVPESPWMTPWQADTLSGLLCWVCARTEGERVLRDEIINPGLNGNPPFVVSDAFPGDWFPIPAAVRTVPWPSADRKRVKRSRWLTPDAFVRIQRGQQPVIDDLIPLRGLQQYLQLRNTLGRTSNSTSVGGGLYPTVESVLDVDQDRRRLTHLTVYVRVRDQTRDLFSRLFQELARWGFGADHASGKGQFRIDSPLEEANELDQVPSPTGCIALSTFQPGPQDPTNGSWDAFTKYGKLGPDFGIENVFKRPLIMLRPGACFLSGPTDGWIGRAIPMEELLPPSAASELDSRGIQIVHWAFGLTVPAHTETAHE